MKGKDLIKFIAENKLEDATVHFNRSSQNVLEFGRWYAADTDDSKDTIEYYLEEDADSEQDDQDSIVSGRIELYREASESFTALTTEEALALRKARVPID